MTRLPTTLSLVFSLAACGIPRPDADLCIVNAPNKNRKCYNLKRDYRDDGTLRPGAIPTYRPNPTVEELNKSLIIDSADGPEEGIARVKAWIKKLREAASSCQQTAGGTE